MIVTSTPKRGYDTWVNSAHIYKPYPAGDWMRLQSGQKIGYLWMPIPPRLKGQIVNSAVLTGHAVGVTSAQTLTFKMPTQQWEAAKTTYHHQPTVDATTVTVALPAMTDGQEFSVELKTLVQKYADGILENFGWQITTNAATVQKFATFDSGDPAWTLTIEYGEIPEPPTGQSPDGTVTSTSEPTATFDYISDAGLAMLRFQIDVGFNGSVDYDSGWIPATAPTYSLASPLTISAGTLVAYRFAVQDADGDQSQFGDWATYTYQPLGTGAFLSPAAGVLYDPTSEIIAQLTGATLAAFRVWVTDGNDRTRIRYDSGKISASDPALAVLELPLKNDQGSRIFTDDSDYQIHVRLFDTYDRQATPDGAAWVDLWTTVHFDDDLALDPVLSFQVNQIDQSPFVRLTWTDSAAADAYLVFRDNEVIARLDPADIVTGASAYSWVDLGAAPAVQHMYAVRRLTDGMGRSAAKRAAIRIDPEGIWLLRPNGDYVVLDDTGVDQLVTNERRLRYYPTNRQYPVDIVTQYEGISGPVRTSIEDDVDQTYVQARDVLDAIKMHPTEAVQLIYATVSKPVLVSNLTVLPDPEYRSDMNRHVVTFNVDQCGDFDYRLP